MHQPRRPDALVVTMLAALALGMSPWTAAADPIGGVLVIPGSGNDLHAIRLRTSAGCPAQANAFYATMKGHGFPPDGQVVTANTAAGMSHSLGFDVYLELIMRDFANDNHTTLGGRYDITVFCINRLTQQSYGELTGSLEFTSPTTYHALGAAKPTGPPPPPLELAGDGSALPPPAAWHGPPAPVPAQASPGADSPSLPAVEPLTRQRDDATGSGAGWQVLVGAVLVALLVAGIVIAMVSQSRKQRRS